MKLYKIRNKETGLYSTGGSIPRWTKVGKSWNNLAHLNSHLTAYYSRPYHAEYNNSEVVEFEVTEKNAIHMLDWNEYLIEMKNKSRVS